MRTYELRRGELQRRAAVLKQYECHCYQVCYYLLRNEEKALQAATACMKHLFGEVSFFNGDDAERLRNIRSMAIRFSLSHYDGNPA